MKKMALLCFAGFARGNAAKYMTVLAEILLGNRGMENENEEWENGL